MHARFALFFVVLFALALIAASTPVSESQLAKELKQFDARRAAAAGQRKRSPQSR